MSDLVERLRAHNDQRLYREADVLMSEAADEITRLRAELESVRADALRLDWLDGAIFVHHWNGVIDSGSRVTWSVAGDYRHTTQRMVGTTLRAAIDAAMGAKT